jgi:hypothetical protein
MRTAAHNANFIMKTTRKRLLNIIITLSVAGNLVLLGGLGYIVSLDNHVNHLCSAMSSPVVIYIPKDMEISSVSTSNKLPAQQ